jgi:hypothetical protein
MPENETPAPRNPLVDKIEGNKDVHAGEVTAPEIDRAAQDVQARAIDQRRAFQLNLEQYLARQGLDANVHAQLRTLHDRVKLGTGETMGAIAVGAGRGTVEMAGTAGRATVETVMDAAKDVPNIVSLGKAAIDPTKPAEQEAAIKKLTVMAGVVAAGAAVYNLFSNGIKSSWTWVTGLLAAAGIASPKLWDSSKGKPGPTPPPAPPAGPTGTPTPAPGPRPAPGPAPKPDEAPANRLAIGGKQVEFTTAGGLKITVGGKTYAAFDKDGPLNMITNIEPGASGRLAVTMNVEGNVVPTTVGVADLDAILGGLRPTGDTNADLTLTIDKADTRKIPMAYDWIVRGKLKKFGALTEDPDTWYCTPSLTLRPVSA